MRTHFRSGSWRTAKPDELLMSRAAALKLSTVWIGEFQVSPDGEKAIEFIEALDNGVAWHRPHIVLKLDLNLPRKGGARVLERIRHSQICARVPVVVVTSSDSPGDKSQVSRLGATRYFQKPLYLVVFMKLGPLVREVLDLQPGWLIAKTFLATVILSADGGGAPASNNSGFRQAGIDPSLQTSSLVAQGMVNRNREPPPAPGSTQIRPP